MNRKLAALMLVPAFALASAAAFAAPGGQNHRGARQDHRGGLVGGPYHPGDRGDRGDRRGDWGRRGDRDRRWHGDRYRDGDRWRRDRGEDDEGSLWRLSLHLGPRLDLDAWRGGYWHHGWHDGRRGWWWLVGGAWYYYPAPVYPYPSPYVPGTVVVAPPQPAQPAAPPAPARAPVAYWYHCEKPTGYYPYVRRCPGGWTKVPAKPQG